MTSQNNGTVVERTPSGQTGPSGWMVRCPCGYKAGPFAAGAVDYVNRVRDRHESRCLWPQDATTGFMSVSGDLPGLRTTSSAFDGPATR